MKTLLTYIFLFAATMASAETCEETVAKAPVYADNLQIMLTLYEEATWFQKALIKHKHTLEVEAVCDVKLGRGKKSEYWTIGGNIQDETYFHLLIDLYDL